MKEVRFLVKPGEAEIRVDAYLAGRTEIGLSRSYLKRLIEEGHVRVDGRSVRPSEVLKVGASIEVTVPDPEPSDLVPEDIPFEILHEDRSLIVINKPRGLVVHPAAGHTSGTLVNAIVDKIDLEGIGDQLRPGIVQRLDKDTTGVMVVAKTYTAHRELQKQIKGRLVKREYWAVVHGLPEVDVGRIEAPIGRHPNHRRKMAVNTQQGKHAITNFKVLERFSAHTLVECRLETGRTHQIRVHMAYIGHPLVGDPMYAGSRDTLGMEGGQALHARTLGFYHPATGRWMEFSAPLPPDMMALLQRLRGADESEREGEQP